MAKTRSSKKVEDSKSESISMTGKNTKRIRYYESESKSHSPSNADSSDDEDICEENEQKCNIIYPHHYKFADYQKLLKDLSKIPLPTKLATGDMEAENSLLVTMGSLLQRIARECDRMQIHLDKLKEERQEIKNQSRNLAIDVTVTKPRIDTSTPRPGTPNSARTPTSLARVSSFTNLSFIQNVSKVFAPQTVMEKLSTQIRNSTEKKKIAKAKLDQFESEFNNIDTELKLYEYLKSKLSLHEQLKEPEQIAKLAEIIAALPKTFYEKCGEDCRAFLLKFGPKGKQVDNKLGTPLTLTKK